MTSFDFTKGVLPAAGLTVTGATNGTRFNSSGVMVASTAPRFDYDPALIEVTHGLPGLLNEDARTNYLWPSVPDTTNWVAEAGDTITMSATTGPDGAAASQISLRDGTTNATRVYRTLGTLTANSVGAAWVKGTKGASVFLFLDTGTRASWKLHTFNGEWERTCEVKTAVTTGVAFYFSTTREATGAADPADGLSAVTFFVSHCDVQNGTNAISSTIWTTTGTVTRTRDYFALSGVPLDIMKQATGSVVAELVRRTGGSMPVIIVGGSDNGSWRLMDRAGGTYVQAGIRGGTTFGGNNVAVHEGLVQRVGGSWESGAHATCLDGYTPGTSTDASTIVPSSAYAIGSGALPDGNSINGWLLKFDFYAAKQTNDRLQAQCALVDPVNIGDALPRGADLLGYTRKVYEIHPTVDDISPSPTDQSYAFSNYPWYGTPPADNSAYYNTADALALPLFSHILAQTHVSTQGTLPYLKGSDGFYVEFDTRLSDNHNDHFPAVWVQPTEHNGDQDDIYDVNIGEQWMEFDVDEGGSGKSTTSTVIYWEGYFPNYTRLLTNLIARGWIDRTKKHTFGASYDPKNNVCRWYLDNVKIFEVQTAPKIARIQNFYPIAGSQTHGANIPYTHYVSRIRAYTVPPPLPPPPFEPEAATFDGTLYYSRGAGLTGAADSRYGSVSGWFDMSSGNGTSNEIIRSSGGKCRIYRDTANRVAVTVANGASTFTFRTVSTLMSADGEAHFCATWDTNFAAGLKVGSIYKNGVLDVEIVSDTAAAFTTDFTETDWAIGATTAGGNTFRGTMKELMFWPGVTIDWSNPVNLAKVSDGAPVDPGADGSLVTGTAPIVYLSIRPGDVAGDFATNRGTGGNFSSR